MVSLVAAPPAPVGRAGRGQRGAGDRRHRFRAEPARLCQRHERRRHRRVPRRVQPPVHEIPQRRTRFDASGHTADRTGDARIHRTDAGQPDRRAAQRRGDRVGCLLRRRTETRACRRHQRAGRADVVRRPTPDRNTGQARLLSPRQHRGRLRRARGRDVAEPRRPDHRAQADHHDRADRRGAGPYRGSDRVGRRIHASSAAPARRDRGQRRRHAARRRRPPHQHPGYNRRTPTRKTRSGSSATR